jgi:integrase
MDATSSPNTAAEPATFTIATATAAVRSWDDLSDTRRRDMVSALSCLATLRGLPAGAVPLTVAEVSHALRDSEGAAALNRSRWSNLRSLLAAVMRRLGIIDAEARIIAPEWCALLARLVDEQRDGLGGLARLCSAWGISPGEMTADVLVRYRDQLTQQTLSRDPAKQTRSVRQSWNRAARSIPGWPTGVLPAPTDARQYTLTLDTFPPTFRSDLDAFARRMTMPADGGELFDRLLPSNDPAAPGPSPRPMRAISVAARRDHCRWGASALAATGMPVSEITSLSVLVEPANAKALLGYLHRRADGRPSATAMHVAEALRIVAKYHVGSPPEQVEQLKRFAKVVTVPYRGMTIKNEKTVRQALHPATERELLELPAAMFKAAADLHPTDPRGAASLAMRGLAIEILTMLPVRLKNLRSIRLDQHLHRADPRKKLITALLVQLDESKNERPLALTVNRELGAMIQLWIDRYRPHVASPDCTFLFSGHGTGDRPISPQALREAIKTTTKRYVGVEITPHQFRHIAAARYLAAYPGALAGVTELLGHRDPGTARRAYTSAQQDAVTQQYDDTVLQLRRVGRQQKPKRASGPPRPKRGGA